jgi:DNA-damage-inducible protein J
MRIDPALKKEAMDILKDLGLSLSGAVTIFLKAVVREQGLPFDLKRADSSKNPGDRTPASEPRI